MKKTILKTILLLSIVPLTSCLQSLVSSTSTNVVSTSFNSISSSIGASSSDDSSDNWRYDKEEEILKEENNTEKKDINQ